MNINEFYLLQVASTLSVLFPLILGLVRFNDHSSPIKFFIIFLGIGLVTDLSGWYLYLQKDASTNVLLRYIYDLIESCFLIGFTINFVSLNILRDKSLKVWILIVPLWIISLQFPKGITIFETTSQMLVSFISSFGILQIIERQAPSRQSSSLVILIGIFFYCFCTFFFQSLLFSQIGLKIWFLHNVINILTNIIYFWGFWKVIKHPLHP